MEAPLTISNLNDFIFCPASIYFHNMYGSIDTMTYQKSSQINGTFIHSAVDNGEYSTNKDVLQGVDVYCEKYNIIGKIDLFDKSTGKLTERKKHISKIYDGYVYQVYAQYFALIEMNYTVKSIVLYSYDDNKNYSIPLPDEDIDMLHKLEKTIYEINNFKLIDFQQENKTKCDNCIYCSFCDVTLNL